MKPYVSIGELFHKYSHEQNPVTRSVYRDIIANRLDALEDKSHQALSENKEEPWVYLKTN